MIATLSIGSGYAAGDTLEVGNGIVISVGAGDFGAGDSFDADAFASSDTAGVPAAIGMNALLSGNSAADIAVRPDIVSSPTRIAAALGADMSDNTNVVRMAGIKDLAMSNLNSMTAPEYYRRLVTDVGSLISNRQMSRENAEVIIHELTKQQSEMSGVDINDEAARLLLFEQMFNAMAKYLSTVQASVLTIMEAL